jgi:hypothetical protein
MPVDAIIRVSFQSSATANRAAHEALTGVKQGVGTGPFAKVGTAAYVVSGGNDIDVGAAIARLGTVLSTHATKLDFFSVSLART